MSPGLVACLASLCLILWGDEVLALERAALALDGPGCEASQLTVIEALKHLDGVELVETDLIPDHLLIDHDGRHVTGKALADFVNALTAAGGRCRAVVMKSCITAGLEPRVALSPPAR
jgi:hypothetical protein